MLRDVSRAALYRGKLNLWVEDEITRSYLRELWGDSSVSFLVAGGNNGVRGAVLDAEHSGFSNVFGVIDRDFLVANKEGWSDPKKSRTFVLPKHELENYLLDSEALAASRYNNLGRRPDEITTFMLEYASRLCWWAACCDVVAELRSRFREGFLHDPKPPKVIDESSARDHLCDSSWYKGLPDKVNRSGVEDVHRLLAEAHIRTTAHLGDGRWRDEFAGKEIFRNVGSRIFDRQKSPLQAPKGVMFDSDLAKDVAVWQVENKAVPQDLSDLLAALKFRIAPITPRP